MSNANLVERRVRCAVVGVTDRMTDLTSEAVQQLKDMGVVLTFEQTYEVRPLALDDFPFAFKEPPPPTQHGPQRKGRGGKLRRW